MGPLFYRESHQIDLDNIRRNIQVTFVFERAIDIIHILVLALIWRSIYHFQICVPLSLFAPFLISPGNGRFYFRLPNFIQIYSKCTDLVTFCTFQDTLVTFFLWYSLFNTSEPNIKNCRAYKTLYIQFLCFQQKQLAVIKNLYVAIRDFSLSVQSLAVVEEVVNQKSALIQH